MLSSITIILATKNRHKAREMAEIFELLAQSRSLEEWEREVGEVVEPVEDGADFTENAVLKAVHYAKASGHPCLADDSGLSVAALDGRPGVHSARYGGANLSDFQRCLLLLEEMRGIVDRRAVFTSVLALARPDSRTIWWRGELPGLLSSEPRGQEGFGYDPIFFHPPSRRTLAELAPEEKNRLSHRAQAARALKEDEDRVRRFLAPCTPVALLETPDPPKAPGSSAAGSNPSVHSARPFGPRP